MARMHPITLRFQDTALEEAFQDSYLPTLKALARVGMILAIVLFIGFGVLDIWVIPDHTHIVWTLRLAIIAFYLLIFFTTYTSLFQRFPQSIMFLASLIGGLCLIVMVAIIPLEAGYYYYAGISLAIFFYYVIVGLRFPYALLANTILLTGYQIVAIVKTIPPHMIINNDFFLFGATIIAATAGYIIERQRRISYLQNREMQLLKEAADAANKAKSRFLASMSHELRTPLNAIIGYSEMLIDDVEDLENKHIVNDLQAIEGSGRHLLRMINNILDLAKIEAGKIELYQETLAISELIKRIEYTATPLAAKNNNKFLIDVNEAPKHIVVDGMRLEQILINLIGNACKFTKNGEIRLTVKSIDERILFQIEDTGIGMSEEESIRLFEDYQQARLSRTNEYGGTGLGLPISKQLIDLMKGTISVTSIPGKGSCFSVRIPA